MDPAQGWRGRDKPNQGMGAETRAMIGNPQIRNQDLEGASLEAELPEPVAFDDVPMTPELEIGPAAPVPPASTGVPNELAPPAEMTAGDSFFDLRPGDTTAFEPPPPSPVPAQASSGETAVETEIPSVDIADGEIVAASVAPPGAEDIVRLAAELEAERQARADALEDLRLAREEVEHARAAQAALMSEIEGLRATVQATPQTTPGELEIVRGQAVQLQAALDEATHVYGQAQQTNEQLTQALAAAQQAQAQAAAEITRLNDELARASAPPKGASTAEHEEQIKSLKKDLAARDRELRETREQLDSESARSFRLSQRRIPALQNELAEAHAQAMELRRKMEKLEAEKRVVAENAESLQRQYEELERALAAAKARLSDTAIIAPPEAQVSLADEEIKRLAGRLKAAEEERRKLSESLAQIDKGRRGEIDMYAERLKALQAESNERHENYLGLRKQIKLLAGRLGQSLKLAAMLAAATDTGQRKMLLEGIEKLARETESSGGEKPVELASLAPPAALGVQTPSAPPIHQTPSAPSPSQPEPVQSLGAAEDLVEPSAEPAGLDGLALEPGLDGIADDLGGPATDV